MLRPITQKAVSTRQLLRLPLAVLVCALASGGVAFAAFTAATDSDANSVAVAASFDLMQVDGTAGCLSYWGAGGCGTGRGLFGPYEVALDPDGKHVYAASPLSNTVAVLTRNATTGGLTQVAGTAGCVSESGSNGCADVYGIASVSDVVVSPDGAHVYTTMAGADGVLAVFSRDGTTGALTQLAGTAGCVSATGSSGACTVGRGLNSASDVSLSPDGSTVYTASPVDDAIGVFARNPSTGVLTQAAGAAGCVSETGAGMPGGAGDQCADGRALDGARAVVVSADGADVYAASDTSDAIARFSRTASSGALAQPSATSGCISQTGTGGACLDGNGFDGVRALVLSPDGAQLYTASTQDSALAILTRGEGGALSQAAGTAGCFSDTGSGGTCADGIGMTGATEVAVDPGGTRVWVSGTSTSAVATFFRGSPGLVRPPGTAACTSETGTTNDGGVCADGRALSGVRGIQPSPDGRFLYAAGESSDAVTVLAR